MTLKQEILKRLLDEKHITFEEMTTLLQTDYNIAAPNNYWPVVNPVPYIGPTIIYGTEVPTANPYTITSNTTTT